MADAIPIKLAARPPHAYQQAFLARAGADDGSVTVTHAVAGRGGGKTFSIVLKLFDAVYRTHSGIRGALSCASYKDIIRIFLPTWRSVVPAQLQGKLNRQDMTLTLPSDPVTTIDLISREAYQHNRGKNKGANYGYHIADELAKDLSSQSWRDIFGSVRVGRFKFCDSASTPKLGWYQSFVESDNSTLVSWSSRQNPYLSAAFVDSFARQLSPEEARREIDAQFVALSGRIWRNYSELDWPQGNRHYARFDRSKPFIVGMDIGSSTAAAVIIQRITPTDRTGQIAGNRPLYCIVGEYAPNGQATDQIMTRISVDYGRPDAIYIGADVNTRSSTDLTTSHYIIRQHFGGNVVINAITGELAIKRLQESVLNAQILNAAGQRSLVISRNLNRHDTTNRGVLEVMNQDNWGDESEMKRIGRGADYLPKEGRLEHMRDALLYAMVGLEPPKMHFDYRRAAS